MRSSVSSNHAWLWVSNRRWGGARWRCFTGYTPSHTHAQHSLQRDSEAKCGNRNRKKKVAISFSTAWKWKVKVKSLSCVRLFATPWTAAYQAPPSMGFSRQEYWSGVPLPSPSKPLQGVKLLPSFFKGFFKSVAVLTTNLHTSHINVCYVLIT